MRRPRLVGALVVGLLLALGVASAANLSVGGGDLTSSSVAHPCPGTAAATPAAVVGTSATGVALTLPAGCGARPVQVTVLDGATVVATGSATLTDAGTVPTGPYPPTAALTVDATVSGWDLPTTWSYGPPASCRITDGSTATCAVAVTVVTAARPAGAASATYYDVVVSTDSGQARPWAVTLDLTSPSFGTVPGSVGNTTTDATLDWNGTTNNVLRTSACSALPGALVLAGVDTPSVNVNGNFRFVGNGPNRQRTFSLVVDTPGGVDLVGPGCP